MEGLLQSAAPPVPGLIPQQAPVSVGGLMDRGDQTAKYNTALSPAEEAEFARWLQQSGKMRDLYNYDLRGAWKADAKAATNGHLPDTWKKPNHPTFSNESIYNGPEAKGGRWLQVAPPSKAAKDGVWQFEASPDNLKFQSAEDLQRYFQHVEAGNRLVLPRGN